jgi:hypothetical protein
MLTISQYYINLKININFESMYTKKSSSVLFICIALHVSRRVYPRGKSGCCVNQWNSLSHSIFPEPCPTITCERACSWYEIAFIAWTRGPIRSKRTATVHVQNATVKPIFHAPGEFVLAKRKTNLSNVVGQWNKLPRKSWISSYFFTVLTNKLAEWKMGLI